MGCNSAFKVLNGLMEIAPNSSVLQPAVQCKWLSLFSFVDCPQPYLIANTLPSVRPYFVMTALVHAGDSCPSANLVKVTGRLAVRWETTASWNNRQVISTWSTSVCHLFFPPAVSTRWDEVEFVNMGFVVPRPPLCSIGRSSTTDNTWVATQWLGHSFVSLEENTDIGHAFEF